MAAILIVDSLPIRAEALSKLLMADGHAVTIEADSFRAREHLSGPGFDLLIVDAADPDSGAGLLMAQAKLAWSRTPVLALFEDGKLRRSKLAEMGLWAPDAAIETPCEAGAIAAATNRLLRDSVHCRLSHAEAANDARPVRSAQERRPGG